VANVWPCPTRTCPRNDKNNFALGVQMFALIQQLIGSSGRHPAGGARTAPAPRLR